VYELPTKLNVPAKCPVCGLRGMTLKTCRRICGFTGICHCTEVEGVKCAVVCYFQRRVFDPTNLLNHVAPSIDLVMQILPIQY